MIAASGPAAAGLAIGFGAIVGISLGLTGGGGGILAVPMLVYGVGLAVHDAVPVSLMAVGATALYGALERLRRREVEIATGLIFAAAGMVGAPFGARLAKQLRPDHLLLLFSALMVYVAIRMWTRSSDNKSSQPAHQDLRPTIKPRHVMMMLVLGIATGVLSGIFGVGGGFLIVPALVLVSGMPIHRAVATSLLVIPLVSIAGIAQHLRQREIHALDVMFLFVVGGIAGMWLGIWTGRRMSAAKLQKTFAVVIVAVAAFNVAMTLKNQKSGEHETRASTKLE
jgi:uncharacterized membrane protein YfcA